LGRHICSAWAAPAIAEAWCKAKLGLATGSLNEHSAMEIIVAIETSRRGGLLVIRIGLADGSRCRAPVGLDLRLFRSIPEPPI